MSEETLLTAARRVARFFRIDEARGGGLISIDTIQAVETLEIHLARASKPAPVEPNIVLVENGGVA